MYQGDYNQETIFSEDPVGVALKWQAMGAPRLHIVDLDGAKLGKPINIDTIAAIAALGILKIEVGGGIRDEDSIKQIPLDDKGDLQSFAVASVAPPGYEVPHAQGYIDLHGGGPRIFSLLTDFGDGSGLRIGCEMGLKIIDRGRDQENRTVFGYRFRPLS